MDDARDRYVTAIHALAFKALPLEDVPASVSDSRWLTENEHVTLSVSPSAGAFLDWLVVEDGQEPAYGVEEWTALSPNIAWYAAYMDVLLNRKRQRRTSMPSA